MVGYREAVGLGTGCWWLSLSAEEVMGSVLHLSAFCTLVMQIFVLLVRTELFGARVGHILIKYGPLVCPEYLSSGVLISD